MAILFAFFGFNIPSTYGQAAIKVAIQYVEGKPVEGKPAYTTQVYFTIMDVNGVPVDKLDVSNLTLSEDSRKVEIKSVNKATDLPIHLVMAMDSSGSMAGSNMTQAKQSAATFVSKLNEEDQIALITFNQDMQNLLDFTADKDAVQKGLSSIQAVPGSGTCLYDVAIKAIQTAATLPSGQRAVILLTDGVDEKPSGGPCSMHTIDDVINLASNGNTRVPIYTIGLGNRIDVKGLQRFAVNTGGSYLYAPDAGSLGKLFGQLSSQLSSQFVLEYESNGAPGAHSLVLNANVNGASDQDSRNFLLPALPITVAITSPDEGSEMENGTIQVSASINGQGTETIQTVVFKSGGTEIGKDTTSPYEISWQPGADATREQTIEVSVIGISGKELAQSVRHFFIKQPATAAAPAAAQPQAAPIIQVVTASPGPNVMGVPVTILIYVGTAIFIVALFVLILVIVLKRKPAALSAAGQPGGMVNNGDGDSSRTLGKLTVMFSDDSSIVGNVIDINQATSMMGRTTNNDISFPGDTPVSRTHATLKMDGSQFEIFEVTSLAQDGTMKRPTYGTFVNEKPVGLEPTALVAGDVIRLGKRLQLKFEPVFKVQEVGEMTMDGFGTGATMDGMDTSTYSQTQPNTNNTDETTL